MSAQIPAEALLFSVSIPPYKLIMTILGTFSRSRQGYSDALPYTIDMDVIKRAQDNLLEFSRLRSISWP